MPPDAARFTLDLDAFVEGMTKGTAPSMRKAQVRYVAYALAILAYGVVATRLDEGRLGLPGVFWLSTSVAFLVLAGLRPALYRRQIRQILAGRADLGRRVEVRLSETDLTIDVEGVRTSTQRLGTLAGVEAFDDGVLVELLAREFLWIPASAFAGADVRERFVRHVLERAPLPDPAL